MNLNYFPDLEHTKRKFFEVCNEYYSFEKSLALTNCYINKLVYNCTYNSDVERMITNILDTLNTQESDNKNTDFITCSVYSLLIN